jgi:hypothetical protein
LLTDAEDNHNNLPTFPGKDEADSSKGEIMSDLIYLIYSLLLLAGMFAMVLADDRRARRRLRQLANWLVIR